MKPQSSLHGLMAEFLTAEEILAATRAARAGRLSGDGRLHAVSGRGVGGTAWHAALEDSVAGAVRAACLVPRSGSSCSIFPWRVDYRLNVAGRPYNSWPVFIPITFEVLVLVAAFAAALGMFYLNGLPRPHHPVFNVPQFARASQDRFFLCIEAADPQFDPQAVARFLTGLAGHGEIVQVEH